MSEASGAACGVLGGEVSSVKERGMVRACISSPRRWKMLRHIHLFSFSFFFVYLFILSWEMGGETWGV